MSIFKKVPNVPTTWSKLERSDIGFILSYPTDSEVLYLGDEIAIIPNWAEPVWDPETNRNVGSPSISIVQVTCKNPDEDMVTNFIKYRPIGYSKYKQGKYHTIDIPGARNTAAYEFRFKLGKEKFQAFSLLVQKEMTMFNITATVKTKDYYDQQIIMKDVVFSFKLI